VIEKRPGDEVGELLEYDEQTAGRIMNPKVFALSEDMTAGEADHHAAGLARRRDGLLSLRRRRPRHLVGVISLRPAAARAAVHAAQADHDDGPDQRQDRHRPGEVARLVASYNLLAIPVVDEENKLVGVITVDDVIDVIKDEATEDVYRLAGVAGDDRVFTSAPSRCASACRGSQVNLVTAFSPRRSSRCSRADQGLPALAVFMPVVAGMGGNAATQTLTVIVRGIALGELTGRTSRKALFKEARSASATAWPAASSAALVVWIWKGTLARRDPLRRDDHQHVRRRDGRHADPAGAARDEGRSRAGLVGVHHDADRRVRLRVVARAGHALHQVPEHAAG
jgi:magnesium transporter